MLPCSVWRKILILSVCFFVWLVVFWRHYHSQTYGSGPILHSTTRNYISAIKSLICLALKYVSGNHHCPDTVVLEIKLQSSRSNRYVWIGVEEISKDTNVSLFICREHLFWRSLQKISFQISVSGKILINKPIYKLI